MSPYVPRTKQDRRRLEPEARPRATTDVRLECGCVTHASPEVTNPNRWWCHGGWQARRR